MKYILFLILLLGLNSKAQQLSITGQISDKKNEPIGLATIDVVGRNVSGTSDDDGIFHISLHSSVKLGDIIILRISKLGYRSLTRQVAVSLLSIPLKLDKLSLFKKHITHELIQESPQVQKSAPTVQIINKDQKGGISAGILNLSIPEDKEIPIANNIIIKELSPNIIQFSPIQGTWKIPYVELLDRENETINPYWYWNKFSGASITSFSYWSRTIGDRGPERFARRITGGPAASPSVPYFLKFDKMPSIIVVGDQSDSTKTYIYIINKP
jgi:hypothetical protein